MPPVKKPGANGAPGRIIDLDQARIARAEQAGDPVTLKFGGSEFEMPAEMPIEFAFAARDGDLRAAVDALLGDQAATFFELRPSVADITELAEAASTVYGVGPGEADASPSS